MKKRFKVLIASLIAVLSLGLSTSAAFAVPDPTTGEVDPIDEDPQSFTYYTVPETENCRSFLGMTAWDCGTHYTNAWTQENIKSTIITVILNITTDITVLAAYLILFYVIWGGYRILASGGDFGRVVAGRAVIIHAFLGLGVVLLAHVIFNIIRIGLLANTKNNGYIVGGVTVSLPSADSTTLVANMISWIIGIGGILALGFMIYGGITFMSSNGNPGKVKMGKDILIYAFIGLLIAGLAEAITAFVTSKINESKQLSPSTDPTSYVVEAADDALIKKVI